MERQENLLEIFWYWSCYHTKKNSYDNWGKCVSSLQHMGCCRSGVCRHSNGLFLPSWSRSQAQRWNLSSQRNVETAKTKHKAMCTHCYITADRRRRRWFRHGDCGGSILISRRSADTWQTFGKPDAERACTPQSIVLLRHHFKAPPPTPPPPRAAAGDAFFLPSAVLSFRIEIKRDTRHKSNTGRFQNPFQVPTICSVLK